MSRKRLTYRFSLCQALSITLRITFGQFPDISRFSIQLNTPRVSGCCFDLLALGESPELGTDADEVWPQRRVLVPATVDQLQQLVARRVHSNLALQVRTKRDFLLLTHERYYFCTAKQCTCEVTVSQGV